MSDVEEMFAALRRQVDDVPRLRAGCDMLEARLQQREDALHSQSATIERLREALDRACAFIDQKGYHDAACWYREFGETTEQSS